MHRGNMVDIVELVHQLVVDQLTPLKKELNDQALKQDMITRNLTTQRILDQEQSFLRGLTDHWRSLREVQKLRRERATYK